VSLLGATLKSHLPSNGGNQTLFPEFLTLPEVAQVIGVPIDTVRHWRKTGYGPKSARIGRRVFYRAADVHAWLNDAFDNAS
jgi:predicted DNA-binding transcriptional regulator AlpA